VYIIKYLSKLVKYSILRPVSVLSSADAAAKSYRHEFS